MSLLLAIASGRPSATPASDKYREAAKLAADDDNEGALVLVDQGLADAPKDLRLLELKGTLLLKTRDYEGALAAYQAYLDAGAVGANRRAAERIIKSLEAVKTSFLELEVTNGSASIYLDSKSQGVVCTESCKKGMIPGDYKVIAERPGFARFTGRVTIKAGQTAKLAITLVDDPSKVAIHVEPKQARVDIDGKMIEGAELALPGGDHAVEVSLPGYATQKLTIAAHEGKPVTIDVTLVARVPISMSAPAELALDGRAIAIDHSTIAIPAGDHVLVAHAAGFKDVRVAIPAARPDGYRIELAFAKLGPEVDVAGAPDGARLVVDGKTVATVPLDKPVQVAAGAHDIEVTADGFLPYRAHAELGERRVHVEVQLKSKRRRVTYFAAAATASVLLIGVAMEANAVDLGNQRDQWLKTPGVTPSNAGAELLKSNGDRYQALADASFGVALVGVAATAYLYYREGRGESKGTLQAAIGPGTVLVAGHF